MSNLRDFTGKDRVMSGTVGTKIQGGTTGQRVNETGRLRFNTTTSLMEYYDGTGWKSIDSPPVVSSIDVTEVDSQAGGNQTIVVTGSAFASGATVSFIGASGTDFNATSVTFDSVSQLTVVAPKASFLNAQEPYGVKVTNPSGLSATLAEQINVDSAPTWSTSSGSLGQVEETDSANFSVSASDPDGDTVAYSETGGTVLSSNGLSINSSSGAITGTAGNVSGDTTINFNLRATAGSKTADRAFSIIIKELALNGTSSSRAAGSPYQIAQNTSGTPSTGVYWLKNSGYNSGNPFQILCDWSLNSTYGHIILCGLNRTNNAINSYSSWGTASTGTSGTRGILNDFYEPSANILNGWSGDSRNRFIVGMTQRSSSTSLSAAGSPQWFEMNLSPSSAKGVWDNQPGVGQYTGSIGASSSGTTGSYYYTTSHGNSIWQMTTSSNTVNSNLWMEMRVGGNDGNHSGVVWGSGNGSYYVANAPYTSRFLFMGFSPNNTV